MLKSIYFMFYIRNTLAIEADVGVVIGLNFAMAILALHGLST